MRKYRNFFGQGKNIGKSNRQKLLWDALLYLVVTLLLLTASDLYRSSIAMCNLICHDKQITICHSIAEVLSNQCLFGFQQSIKCSDLTSAWVRNGNYIAEMIIFAFTCAVKEQSRRSGQPPHRGCLWCVWRTIGTGTPLRSCTGKGGRGR